MVDSVVLSVDAIVVVSSVVIDEGCFGVVITVVVNPFPSFGSFVRRFLCG